MKNAEEIVNELMKQGRGRIYLTTSQIRKILSATNLITNKIKIYQVESDFLTDKLPQDIIDEINYLRIRILYQAGRERNVKEFVKIAELDKRLKELKGSIKNYLEFNRFIEGIVAYHKYNGGK